MRANRGFTLVELMVVVAISLVVAALVIWQGRSARQAAGLAGGAYELALRIGGLKARAMADGREYVLVVTDTASPDACRERERACGRAILLRNPDPAFTVVGFDPEAPVALAEWHDDGASTFLPRNSQLDLASAWTAPVPFASVTASSPVVLATCAGGVRCFGLRFRPDGEVRPVVPPGTPLPAGFAFILRPTVVQSAASERRAVFVSFPAGLVKTAAF